MLKSCVLFLCLFVLLLVSRDFHCSARSSHVLSGWRSAAVVAGTHIEFVSLGGQYKGFWWADAAASES